MDQSQPALEIGKKKALHLIFKKLSNFTSFLENVVYVGMKIFLISLSFFYLSISYSYSITLSDGQVVSGTLTNLYGQGINITLPDGKWEVTSSKKDQYYTDIELYSEKYDTWAYIYTPVAPLSGDFWGNRPLKKCSGKNVFLSLVDRSSPEATLCFQDLEIEGDQWGVVSLDARTLKTPLLWLGVEFYTPIENVKTSLTDEKIKMIGKDVFKALRSGLNGGSSNNMALLSKLITGSNVSQNSLSQGEDSGYREIQKLYNNLGLSTSSSLYQDFLENYKSDPKNKAVAIARNNHTKKIKKGDPKWGIGFDWPTISAARNSAMEECQDGLSVNYECLIIIENTNIIYSFEKLQNDIQFASSNKNDTASSNTSDDEIKLRLQKLKKLLDDGLISQEQYQVKSSEILDSL